MTDQNIISCIAKILQVILGVVEEYNKMQTGDAYMGGGVPVYELSVTEESIHALIGILERDILIYQKEIDAARADLMVQDRPIIRWFYSRAISDAKWVLKTRSNWIAARTEKLNLVYEQLLIYQIEGTI